MPTIKYSKNHNRKLDATHNVVTTIRKWTAEKERYYRDNCKPDVVWEEELNGEPGLDCTLVSVEVMSYCSIPFALLASDTGLTTKKEIDALFEKFGIGITDTCLLLTFRRRG